MKETPGCPKLTAINESAVAAIFQSVEQCVQIEIDSEDEITEPFYWRRLVLAALHEDEGAADLPPHDCTDKEEWSLLIDCLAGRILWDADYDDGDLYLDSPPEKARAIRKLMGIDEDYYCAIPPDPSDNEIPMIRAKLRELCGDC